MKQPMKLDPTEYATVVWHWTVPAGQSLADLLEPAYWQHVTQQLRPGHEIKASAEDRTFWGHLYVRSVGKAEAKVSEIHSVSFDAVSDQEDDDETYIKWRSPKSKFAVYRKSDDELLKDGFEAKEDAQVWAVNRNAVMAA